MALLIYLPGMEGTGKLFYRQEVLLRSLFKVIPVASRSQAPFDYEQLVEDVRATIQKEGVEKAIIVAESFGGTVALLFALKHPDRIERLILINTFPYFRRRIRLRLGQTLLPLTFFPLGNRIREFFYKFALGFEGVEKEDVQRLSECSFSHGYAASRNRMQLIEAFDVRDQLREINVPVTLIASARDKIVPSVREARFMAERLRNNRLVILSEHGHTPLITATFSLAPYLI